MEQQSRPLVRSIPIPQMVDRPPEEKPPFTLKQLRDKIPSTCFEKSTSRSLYFVIRDLVQLSVQLYIASKMLNQSLTLQLMFWPIYTVLQTGAMGGLFILGHECCHGAFSNYRALNDVMGIFLHSITLVPHLGYKFAHHKHHRFTSNYDMDNSHAPFKKKVSTSYAEGGHEIVEKKFYWMELLEASFLYQIISLCLYSLHFSFYYYIILWHKSDELVGKKATLLTTSWKHPFLNLRQVVITTLADSVFLLSWMIVLRAMTIWGFVPVIFMWIVPTVGSWLVFGFVAYLHHTDSYVPWYADAEWSWLRGALSTVDRSLGTFMDNVTHNISKYHVIHHLFPQIPFYHAEEATEAIKPILGKYYLKDDTNFVLTLYRTFVNCKFIDGDEAIAFHQNFSQSSHSH